MRNLQWVKGHATEQMGAEGKAMQDDNEGKEAFIPRRVRKEPQARHPRPEERQAGDAGGELKGKECPALVSKEKQEEAPWAEKVFGLLLDFFGSDSCFVCAESRNSET